MALAAFAAVLLGVVLLLQWRAGAFTATFGTDASAHYLSGLMAHDWIAAGPGGNPVRYSIDYHAHLPPTSFGHLPPVFYGVEAVWMLGAGTGKASVLVLSAVVTAALGLVRAVGRRDGIRRTMPRALPARRSYWPNSTATA